MNQFILNIMIVYSIASVIYLLSLFFYKSKKLKDILTDEQIDEYTKIKKQKGGAPIVPFDYTPSAPLASCAGQVNPMPNVNVPMAMQNKNLINNEDNATEISEIQNTEDIAKLFSQYGGKHKESSSSESSKSSSTSSSTDSDISTSDSF